MFGHVKSRRRKKTSICFKCSEAHDRATSPATNLTCINCKIYNASSKTNKYASNHHALSSTCEVRRSLIEEAKERINVQHKL